MWRFGRHVYLFTQRALGVEFDYKPLMTQAKQEIQFQSHFSNMCMNVSSVSCFSMYLYLFTITLHPIHSLDYIERFPSTR